MTKRTQVQSVANGVFGATPMAVAASVTMNVCTSFFSHRVTRIRVCSTMLQVLLYSFFEGRKNYSNHEGTLLFCLV
uniref:Secreted protein n=1 Tax=Panagrellus redivivus TaxID=6233 RepID=A0A7E4W4W4_PANRE